MRAEIVNCRTTDDIRLDGAFLTPDEAQRHALCDSVLLVHGSGGNFYRGLGGLASSLREMGYPVAAFNNTGHDLARGAPGRLFGNAFEILDRCRLDLDAALTWLEESGYHRVALVGTSMGAVKSVYYGAHVPDPRVAAIVPVSPVRLSYSYFMQSDSAAVFEGYYKKAEALIARGEPEAVFPVTFPIPHLFSARSYVDKHNADERYNIMRFIDKVPCPIFLAAGGLEVHPRLRDCASDAYKLVSGDKRNRLLVMPDADHGFPGKAEELAAALTTWFLESAPIAAVGEQAV